TANTTSSWSNLKYDSTRIFRPVPSAPTGFSAASQWTRICASAGGGVMGQVRWNAAAYATTYRVQARFFGMASGQGGAWELKATTSGTKAGVSKTGPTVAIRVPGVRVQAGNASGWSQW